MDTHDVSQVSEYLAHLQKQKRTLQNAQSRKGQTPKPTKSRDEIIMYFMFRRMMASNRPVYQHALKSSFVPPAYPPSTAALGNLKKIMIKNLTLETHHRGSYILLRAVTPTDIMTAIMAVAEDERGDALRLQLYNQEKDLATDGRLVEGTIMIVKEPYLKLMADGDYGLRVDHLSDIRLVPDHDPLVPASWRRRPEHDASAHSWKTEGNEFFNQAKYHLAIDCYSKALDSSPTSEETLAIRLNRALTCLKTHQFDAALHDLDLILTTHESSEKALFRKSQALYHLQKFQDSSEVHKVLSKKYTDNMAAKSEFDRATARLIEEQSGQYPFKRLQLEAKKRHPPHLDRATYIGPVSVRPTESRGRELFTTEAVQAGDLLFCEKALAHAFHDDAGEWTSVSLLMNSETETMTMGTQADLIGLIAQKLYKSPSLMSAFTDLYHGSYTPVGISEVDGTPVVDTFLIERIMSLNCFGCPLSSRAFHIHTMKDEAQRLESPSNQFHSCGVWTLASYINHSCYSNARRAFIGDMMVVRATQDLPANTELTFWYKVPWDIGSPEEEQLDLHHWGFKCRCAICQDLQDTRTSDLRTRKQLTASLVKAFQSLPRSQSRQRNAAIAQIKDIVSALEETYRRPCSEIPRLGIWKAYLSLAMVHATSNQPRKAVEFALRTLESLGYVIEGGQLPPASGATLSVRKWGLVMDDLVGCWMILCSVYRDVAPELVDRAEEYAKITYRMCVGEDETFGDTYSRCSERVDGLIVGAK
ncbi:TPR domain protein [Aspergillus steynii IBT 23096]|uniref:TPR domain protein n=1 Tax=Aspergillus steynii IBT 23096 TaxID=1392250 RepID=A0A2I2GIQ5_9EURO|nr:TPR domain protein [Aspergillus steynii IBT 23096]PLB52765.1 TPR domain protein [Aspergillus steynii IBT 23096]